MEEVTEYLITATQKSPVTSLNIVLRALGAVLYKNGPRLESVREPRKFLSSFPTSCACLLWQFADQLLGEFGLIRLLIKNASDEILRSAIQCVENFCIRLEKETS